jgi:two-component system, OmpR family, sensor histidine kinase CiaH
VSDTLTQFRSFLRTDTARLMLTYLSIIMIMSLSFSTVLYMTSAGQLERQRPPRAGVSITDEFPMQAPSAFRAFIDKRIAEGKREIFAKLAIINILVLASGSFFSYYLARRTLEPMEAAMEAQSQFVSDASHELRTPLTALRTSNEVALRRKKLTLTSARETIKENLEEIERLQQLTDGLLRLSTRDGGLQLGPVNLQQTLDTALSAVALKAADKRIAVDNQMPALSVNADAGALAQILTILLDNAIKYSPEDTTITIRAAKDTKNGVYIHVADQGMGIDAQDAQHIFSRFYRADISRSETQGYGLGLPIAHKLVQAHQGKLSVESTPGEGSTFTVYLPQ